MDNRVYVIQCPDYGQAEERLVELVDLMGGMNAFVNKGETIALKVNLLRAGTPDEAVSTHPTVVSAVARMVKKGAKMEPKEYKTESGVYQVYDKYIIARVNANVDVDQKEVKQLHGVVSKHFSGDFGLIEDRVNQNSINPMAYVYAKEMMPNFKAFALVVYTDMAETFFDSEKVFMESIEHKAFRSLPEACEWMDSIL